MWDGYGYLVEDLADPRTKDWFLVKNPLIIASILVSYNYFCIKMGPNIMKNREPFEMKIIIKLYNLFHIMLSMFIFREACVEVFFRDFSLFCHRVNQSTDPTTLRLLSAVWLYYVAKLAELLDTVIFVLKKSNRQISFLHLYHHTLMAVAAWVAVKYFPGGQAIIIGWINSFIHIIMYIYYLMASYGPKYKRYLWWKKYLTVMQIVQFGVISIQFIISLFHDCGFPTVIKLLVITGTSAFTWMFSSFYYNSYIKPRELKKCNTCE
ncbi:unnamed protein product, partial [Iphiclides podalirius]